MEVGTLWPSGQQVNWNSCTVLGVALTPAINSVNETIFVFWFQPNIPDIFIWTAKKERGKMEENVNGHNQQPVDII